MKVEDLSLGDTFMYRDVKYIIKTRDDKFTYCFRIPRDGYNHWFYNYIDVDVDIQDETFKSNPDHKRNMHK